MNDFANDMAEAIFDAVIRDSMPLRLKTEEDQLNWARTRRHDVLTYNGGAAWDRAFEAQSLEDKNVYEALLNKAECDTGEGSAAQALLDEINSAVDKRLLDLVNAL